MHPRSSGRAPSRSSLRSEGSSGIPGVQDGQQGEIDQRMHRTGAVSRGLFRDASDVQAFVSVHRGFRFKTPIAKAAHDWALVTFLMAADGAVVPSEGVTRRTTPAP